MQPMGFVVTLPRTVRKGHARRCASASAARTTAGHADGADADVASTRPHDTRASGQPAVTRCGLCTGQPACCFCWTRTHGRTRHATRLTRARRAGPAPGARGSRLRRTHTQRRAPAASPQTACATAAPRQARRTAEVCACTCAPGRRCAAWQCAACESRPASQRRGLSCWRAADGACRSAAAGSRPCRARWAWRGRRRRRHGRTAAVSALVTECAGGKTGAHALQR